MAEPVVLSASSIATFLRCGMQWEFAYVYNLKSKPSIRQSVGIAFHDAVGQNLTQKIESKVDLPEADIVDAFSDSYDDLVVEVEKPEEDPDGAKGSGILVVRKYSQEVAPSIEPVWVERSVQYRINGIPYSGTVDLVDTSKRVRDWKTTGRRPQAGSYLLNMIGYSMGYRHASGETESEVVLDYFVRTKKPYYLPIPSGGPVPDAAVGAFFKVVDQVYAAITKGSFLPNGLLNNACSWCGYRDICPAYNNASTVERMENASPQEIPVFEF